MLALPRSRPRTRPLVVGRRPDQPPPDTTRTPSPDRHSAPTPSYVGYRPPARPTRCRRPSGLAPRQLAPGTWFSDRSSRRVAFAGRPQPRFPRRRRKRLRPPAHKTCSDRRGAMAAPKSRTRPLSHRGARCGAPGVKQHKEMSPVSPPSRLSRSGPFPAPPPARTALRSCLRRQLSPRCHATGRMHPRTSTRLTPSSRGGQVSILAGQPGRPLRFCFPSAALSLVRRRVAVVQQPIEHRRGAHVVASTGLACSVPA